MKPLLLLLCRIRHGHHAVDLPAGLAADRAFGGSEAGEIMGSTQPFDGAVGAALSLVIMSASALRLARLYQSISRS